MRRKLNVKLLAITFGCLVTTAIVIHFVHGYQLGKYSYRLREHADRALAAKEYDKALGYYSQYLTFVPDDPDTVQKYAQALDVRAESAAERLRLVLLMEQVLRAKPKESELRFRLIHNLIALDRIPEAMGHLRKLQDVWPEKAEVLHMLGWCQDASNEKSKAVRSLEEAIRLAPTRIDSYALLAEILQDRLHEPEVASKVMQDMVQANPESHRAYLVRAHFLRRQGDEKTADRDLQTAYKLAPDRPEVILAMADAARARGSWEEATRLLQDGLKKFPDQADLYKEMIWVKIHTQKRDEAIDFARAGLNRLPRSNELAVLLVDLMIDQKQYADAQTKIDELEQAGLKPTLPNYLKARLHVARQQWTAAIKLLEEVRQDLGPGSEWSSRVNVLLGVSFGAIGDPEQELQAYRRAVNDEPTWMAANVGMGAALLNGGRVDDAVQTLEPLRTAKDLPAGFWILLARTRFAKQMRLSEGERRWDDVEDALRAADTAEPGSVAVAAIRAELSFAQRDFNEALAALEKARVDHPRDVFVWCALADLAARQNNRAEAERILDQAAADPAIGDRLELRLAKCRLWASSDDPQIQAKFARLVVNLAPTFTPEQTALLKRALADSYYQRGDGVRAQALLSEVARALPVDLRSRVLLLDMALERRQSDAARRWIDEIRKIEGESGSLWRYGSIALQVQEARGQRKELEEARKKLQELEQLHKMGARLPLLAAAIYEQEGKQAQAIQEYMRALDLGDVPPRRMVRLLELLVARREFGKAETELGRYEQKQPLTKDLVRLGADIALGMRESHYATLALTRAKLAVGSEPRDYRDALWLTRIQQAAGDFAGAEKLLSRCLDDAGHVPDVWVAWMRHLTLSNQRPRAAETFDRLKKELPADRQPLTLARAYDALRQSDDAAKAYQSALSATPNDLVTLAFAADFYRRAGQNDKAARLYQRLLEQARRVPADFAIPARRHLALLVTDRKQALELLDENKKLLGHTLADERLRLYVQSLNPAARVEAINRFEETLSVELPTPEERSLFARMLEAADRLGPARTQLADAVDEDPSPQHLARYVQVLLRNFDYDEARRQFARLEAQEPGSERVRELREALARASKEKGS